MNPTTFLEGTVGGGSNRVGAIPVSPFSDRRNPATGFSNFPYIFNQDGVPMDAGYNRDVAADIGAAWFDASANKMYSRPSSTSAVWSPTLRQSSSIPSF